MKRSIFYNENAINWSPPYHLHLHHHYHLALLVGML